MVFNYFFLSYILQGFILTANIAYAMWIVSQGLEGWANSSPTTTSIDTVAAPAKDAPFPAVAVCPPLDHVHDSWRISSIVYDMLDLANCKGSKCRKFRKSFREFTDKLLDQHLASDDEPMDMVYENEDGTITKIPGGFKVPEGYKGLKIVYFFRLLYCELAQVLEQNNDPELIEKMTVRLKNAFLGIEEFDLDILMKEEGLKLDTMNVSIIDVVTKPCDVSNEIMTFLGKIYFLNTETLYENFGTSMERLMAHGDLQIQSWASSVKGFEVGGNIRVSQSALTIFNVH